DENIQDPYNTQIYNKYGYAVNNPLIYNDPSGEVLPFLVGIGIGWFAATVLSGAIIGAAISMGIYILQATIYNNFSLGGFAKSILLGAATGAVSAGLGEVFSASGFLSTVANGALTGAGTGGVTALITGQNFLEGVWKGAVIGGAVAGITYSMQSLFYNKSSQGKALSENDLKNKTSYDPSVSNEEMSCNISQTKGKLFKLKDNFGVGEQSLGKSIDGYLDMGDGGKNKFLAYTGKRNFWTGKSDILYSPRIAQDKYLLKFTMLHETGHAYSNMLFLPDMKINIKGLYNDSTEHLALGFLEHDVASINNLTFRPSSFFTGQQTLENTLKLLNNTQFNFFNRAYRALQPIFNRKISFP
ncbi:hypothetical protein C1637_04120, partial [Chryseobacterium lactis]